MVVQEKLYTADDLLAMSRDGVRRELVQGEIREMTPTGDVHTILAAEIGCLIRHHVKMHQLEGYVAAADGGFVLASDPDTVRSPDAAYISKARLAGPLSGRYFPAAPDLAVEIVSPGDIASEVHEKVLEYLKAGTLLVWVIYPTSRTVAVHTAAGARTLDEDGALEGGDVLPGLRLSIREMFACLEG